MSGPSKSKQGPWKEMDPTRCHCLGCEVCTTAGCHIALNSGERLVCRYCRPYNRNAPRDFPEIDIPTDVFGRRV